MPKRNVRRKSKVALILVDVINHFEFPDGSKVLKNAAVIAPKLARLKARARRSGIPAIYVNDNFGQWRSDAKKLLSYCLRAEAPGKDFVQAIQPDDEDYLVLKPMHSAFYQTPLDILLRYLGTTSIILSGIATNSCIVCTAHDAKMRDLDICIPSDCCAARSAKEHAQALEHIKGMSIGDVSLSTSIRFEELKKRRA